jgi:hypothetical protein
MAQDKGRLYQNLDKQGMPVGNYVPVEKLIQNGAFSEPRFSKQFPEYNNESPVQIISHQGHTGIDDFEDLLGFIGHIPKHPGAVARQSKLETPQTAFVRVIPGADGKALNCGPRATSNGVIAHNVPSSIPNREAVLAAAKEAAKKAGLDYACVFVAYDTKGGTQGATEALGEDDFEILDIVTRLQPEDAVALRSFADMRYAELEKARRKPVHQGHGKRR